MNIKLDIPDSFFQGEERSGYYVKPEMKRIWAVELDLLAEFARVCEKHNLKWFASGGTLLGAARHKGFIPWDDDIDVVMMRKDYERLHEIAAEEFRHPYHLRTKQEGEQRELTFSKLFNEDTTMFDRPGWIYILKHNEKLRFSQGIYIDIFPMDSIPDDEHTAAKMFRKCRLLGYKAHFFFKMTHYYPAAQSFKRVIKAAMYFVVRALGFKSFPYAAALHKFDEAIRSVANDDTTRKVGELCWLGHEWAERSGFFSKHPRIYDRSYFNETIELPFEMLKVPAVAEYDRYLTQLYGNWRVCKIQGAHGQFYDTERSYKYYYENGFPAEANI